jgi:hypothetical protein
VNKVEGIMFPNPSLLLLTVMEEDMHNSTDSLNISFVIQQINGQSNCCCWGRAIINFFCLFANRSEDESDFGLSPSLKI